MPVLEPVPEGDTAPARAQPGPTDLGGSNDNEQTAKARQIAPDPPAAGLHAAGTSAASGDKKKGHYFGLPKGSTNTAYMNPDDYEQKYPEDHINDALGPNARVWRVYLDEAKAFDDNMIDGWKDTIDVLLVFAGLFSAVVTTFVVQTSQSLQPDYSEISALLLTELVGLQRALADGRPPASVPAASKNATSPFAAARSDQWVNGLWFTSLALSLATALMSVLMKQWLQHYIAPVSGTVRNKVHVRQFRYAGIQKWHVGGIVGFLPVLMHISLMLFYLGLFLSMMQISHAIAIVVALIGGLLYAIYVVTNTWAVYDQQCPYKTPVSNAFGVLLRFIMDINYKASKLWLHVMVNTTTTINESKALAQTSDYKGRGLTAEQTANSLMLGGLEANALLWLGQFSSNPSVIKVVYRSLAAINLSVHTHPEMTSYFLQISDYLINFLHMSEIEAHNDRQYFWAWSSLYIICKKNDFKLAQNMIEKNIFWWKYFQHEPLYYHLRRMLIITNFNSITTNTLLNKIFDLIYKTDENWLWYKSLHLIAYHICTAKGITFSRLFEIGFLYIDLWSKSELSWHGAEFRNFQYSVIYNLHILLTSNQYFKNINQYSLSNQATSFRLNYLEMLEDIYFIYLTNIDEWVHVVPQEKILKLIENYPYLELDRSEKQYVQISLSVKVLNNEALNDKLEPEAFFRIMSLCMPRGDDDMQVQSKLNNLNEGFFSNFCKWKEHGLNNQTVYLDFFNLIYLSNKADFWCTHDILSIYLSASQFVKPCDLWSVSCKFVTQINMNLDHILSDQYLNWYCQLYLKSQASSELCLIHQSDFLRLMSYTLANDIWKEILQATISKLNNLCHCLSKIHKSYYHKELQYVCEMRRKLNICCLDSSFNLYAYISGADRDLLQYAGNGQYAPCSILYDENTFLHEAQVTQVKKEVPKGISKLTLTSYNHIKSICHKIFKKQGIEPNAQNLV